MARVLVAKTGLDGHWRGVMAVATALREAGFEVILLGMATGEEIAAAAVQEDADLVGLNVGGHIEVAERVIAAVREAAPDTPVIAGGTVPPWAVRRLADQGVPAFPPGSRLQDIVDAARRLTSDGPDEEAS
ncbi:MAG TPA: cobalamin-dependent protein [Acidimicrobiales bacterium]|nr:cobalamin-dependent protein [Acidimicrobiales bacterium]